MIHEINLIKMLQSVAPLDRESIVYLEGLVENIMALGFECFATKNQIACYYEDMGVAKLVIVVSEGETKINLEKIKKSERELIQQQFTYFNEYWREYLADFSIDLQCEEGRAQLIDSLRNILEIFFDDLSINFRINEIEFKDYRSFKNESIFFNEKLTVLIGRNSSGKTSVLDAAAVALGSFLSGIDEVVETKTIAKEDVRFSIQEIEGAKVVTNHSPTSLIFNTDFIKKRVSWSRTRNSLNSTKLTTKDSNKVVNLVRFLVDEIRNNPTRKITLPVFSYHGNGRVANFTRDMKLLEKTENISRFVGYKDCLKPASNYKFFIAWYTKMQYRAFMLNRRIPTLDAITNCLEEALIYMTADEVYQVERVLYLEGALHLAYDTGEIMPISHLSDGYQDVIGIISDIAYRMVILNPHLGDSVLVNTPGVVLIDEIDVHLHPKWQQKILPLLKRLFPDVQFITTTHSPIIISTTESNEALEIELDESKQRKKISEIGEPKEWYISDILTTVFDIKQEPFGGSPVETVHFKLEQFSDWVKEYLVDHHSHELHIIEQLHDELVGSLAKNSPQYRAVKNLMGLISDHEEIN
ncbi:AAA family ATPase [Solibacillus sp. FSL R7-0668]|uniref:AAA family ATPase n=1 Tax=Solibacillus sp. FSL R7-0668 TaxID=2921688 RepID=UPI0030F8023A